MQSLEVHLFNVMLLPLILDQLDLVAGELCKRSVTLTGNHLIQYLKLLLNDECLNKMDLNKSFARDVGLKEWCRLVKNLI